MTTQLTPLTEPQLLDVFATVDGRCEQDATILRIDAEGGYVDTVEVLGARHGWRAFLRAARAVEAAHNAALTVAHSSQTHGLHGSPARQGARPDGQDLNPDLSASASPATKEQQ